MKLMHDFYSNLDLLELIIFWGIILVIILTIILIIIIVNKKRKNKNDTIKQYPQIEEELPIIETSIPNEKENYIEYENETIFSVSEENNLLEEMEAIVEITESDTEIKEEPKEGISQNKYNQTFEIPSAPYQRNVLREMSLSQTSPIGINRKDDYAKPQKININEITENNLDKKTDVYQEESVSFQYQELEKPIYEEPVIEELIEEPIEKQENNEVDNYDIERTKYEIEQEENAIISYKELMEKKDSIQTIDEEDAVISIEELLNKTNQQEKIKEETKLYNISENEENDSFINELKQFRKDL